jgi:hypothetical protein
VVAVLLKVWLLLIPVLLFLRAGREVLAAAVLVEVAEELLLLPLAQQVAYL